MSQTILLLPPERNVAKRGFAGSRRSATLPTASGGNGQWTRQQISRAASLLVEARRTGALLEGLPADATPASVADAHAIQDAVTAALGKPVGAFKAMAPASGEPTRGVIYADTIHPSPARIPVADVPQCGVEGEVAFVFRRDLPPRPTPYSRDEVAAAVEACAAIELVTSRYRNFRCGIEPGEAGRLHQQWRASCMPRRPADWRSLDLGKPEGDADGERRRRCWSRREAMRPAIRSESRWRW